MLGVVPALLLAAGAAQAGNGYYVRWMNVPDFDQRRAECGIHPGLCGNGANFCGPTTCTDWFAFINNNGFPQVMAPGNTDWQNTHYDFITNTIDHVAGHCFAGLPVCDAGTSFGKIDDCLRDHLDESGVEFMTIQDDCEGDYYIGPNDMGWWMRTRGALCVIEVGWYDHVDNNTQWKMRMGHFVPITTIWDKDAYIGDPDHMSQVSFRDPGSSDDQCSQSPFVSATHNFEREFVSISHLFQFGYDHRYQYKVDGYTSGDRQAFLNNYTALCTYFAVGFPWYTGGVIKLSIPGSHDQDPNTGDHEFDLGNFGTSERVSEVKLHPLLPVTLVRAAAVGVAPPGLWMFDDERGFAQIAPVSGDGHMAFGRKGELYISDGATLKVMQIDAQQRRAATLRTLDLPRPADAVAFDEARDTVVVIDRTAGVMRTYPRLLNGKASTMLLPAVLTGPGTAANPMNIVFDPSTQALWAVTAGKPILYRLTPAGSTSTGNTTVPEQIKLPRTIAPESLNFNDKGRIVAFAGGDIVEFDRDASGRVTQRPRSLWSGRGFGPKFCLARSHSGATPALAATPVLDAPGTGETPSVVECPADFTGPRMDGIPDGVIGDEDRAMFMQLWLAGDPRADIDDGSGTGKQDRRVDDADFAFFLSKYAEGC
jgi:hypothetical protein